MIGVENVDVVAVYEDAFTVLTKKVASIHLKEVSVKEADLQDKYTFMVYTTGAFESSIECRIENPLFEQLARGLNKGQELSEDTKMLYVIEYLNIICGRALSVINGALKSASRLTVPKYLDRAEADQPGSYLHENWIGFITEYGNMQIGLKYNYETQRRQKNMSKTVLVIDDSPFIANQIREGIEGNGYTVVGHARSGEEGITMCEDLTPDIVLLDIIMPGIDGFETAQEIQKKMPEVKIIMLSSLCDNETLEEVRNIGLKYLIPKPLEIDVLMATLELALR
ncbi:MAG: response regulator [Acetivibrio ethanolgignens]